MIEIIKNKETSVEITKECLEKSKKIMIKFMQKFVENFEEKCSHAYLEIKALYGEKFQAWHQTRYGCKLLNLDDDLPPLEALAQRYSMLNWLKNKRLYERFKMLLERENNVCRE